MHEIVITALAMEKSRLVAEFVSMSATAAKLERATKGNSLFVYEHPAMDCIWFFG